MIWERRFMPRRVRNMSWQIERAWREHDAMQGRVPFVVRSALRKFKDELAKEAAIVEAHLYGCTPSAMITDCIKRRGLSRQRALQRVTNLFGDVAVISGSRDAVEIRWLNGRDRLLLDPRDPGEEQPCTCVHFALLWREPSGSTTFYANWLLEVADHALARLIERTPTTDLRQCLFDAADAFAAADYQEAFDRNHSFYLAAGGGAFGAELIMGQLKETNARTIYSRARTFFTNKMANWNRRRLLKPAASPERTVAAMLLSLARTAKRRRNAGAADATDYDTNGLTAPSP
jgi:hypothetical protein